MQLQFQHEMHLPANPLPGLHSLNHHPINNSAYSGVFATTGRFSATTGRECRYYGCPMLPSHGASTPLGWWHHLTNHLTTHPSNQIPSHIIPCHSNTSTYSLSTTSYVQAALAETPLPPPRRWQFCTSIYAYAMATLCCMLRRFIMIACAVRLLLPASAKHDWNRSSSPAGGGSDRPGMRWSAGGNCCWGTPVTIISCSTQPASKESQECDRVDTWQR